MCHVGKRGKIVLNQLLIYIHPFPPLLFFFALFNSVAEKRKIILRHKKYWKDIPPSYAFDVGITDKTLSHES